MVRFILRNAADSQCLANHEERRPANSQNRKGREGDGTRMCLGVHQLYHFRGGREVSVGEEEDDRRRRYTLRYGLAGVRELRGDAEDPSGEAEAGALTFNFASAMAANGFRRFSVDVILCCPRTE